MCLKRYENDQYVHQHKKDADLSCISVSILEFFSEIKRPKSDGGMWNVPTNSLEASQRLFNMIPLSFYFYAHRS